MRESTRGFYEDAVGRAVEQIVVDIDRALDLDSLARQAATSPFHFHRIFRGMVGETPVALSRRLRLERAAEELRTTDRPVTAIAFTAGYETHETFTRAFRAAYGESPSGYRKKDTARLEIFSKSGIHFNHTFRFVPISGGSMDVELVDRQPCRLAVVRHVGAYFAIGDAFATLGQRAGAAGLIGPDSEMIAVFHDDPDTVPVADLQSDAGFSVRDDAVLPDGLGELRLAGGKYARAVHVGPYERLADSWSQLMGEWLPESGHRIGAGGTFEKYLNTPMDTPIDQLRTEIYISLE